MPQKLPPTDKEKRETVRQEGRKGIIELTRGQKEWIGRDRLIDIWKLAEFQIFKIWDDERMDMTHYYGYCPMFIPTDREDSIPRYTMRVTFEKPEPVLELFRRREI